MKKVSRRVVAMSRVDVVSGGPDMDIVQAEVQLTDEAGKSLFYLMAELDGCPMFFRTEESIYDRLADSQSDFRADPKTIIFDGEYDELFEEMPKRYEQVFRYLVYIVRADWDEAAAFISDTKGKILEELEIPVSDIEEELED